MLLQRLLPDTCILVMREIITPERPCDTLNLFPIQLRFATYRWTSEMCRGTPQLDTIQLMQPGRHPQL